MLFWSFFKSLAEKSEQLPVRVTIELKNGVKVEGNLQQVDEQLNFHLDDIRMHQTVTNAAGQGADRPIPHFAACNQTFIRGNVIRYVHMNKSEVDTEPLTEACKKEAKRAQHK